MGRKPSAELEPWIWAVCQQEWIYRTGDAAWIKQAKGGGKWDDAQLLAFLKSYGVMRGYAATWLGDIKNRRFLTRGCFNASKSIRSSNGKFHECATTHWHKVVKNCFNQMQQYSPKDSRVFKATRLHSAISKLLWFHLPYKFPMYDRLARIGLNNLYGGIKVNENNFVERFYDFYSTKKTRTLVNDAKLFCGSNYPYDIRIADKYLWFRGVEAENSANYATTLKTFQFD